jgi:hypothetical protein
MKSIFGTIFIIMVFAPFSYAEGLSTLIEVGKGQAEIQRAYSEETSAYERVQSAVDRGGIKKSMTKNQIQEEYGEPVVSFYDIITKRDEWIYKPAKSDFFGGGIKICLYFDKNDTLDEIIITGQEKDKKENGKQ